jgi:hypothetical protein
VECSLETSRGKGGAFIGAVEDFVVGFMWVVDDCFLGGLARWTIVF